MHQQRPARIVFAIVSALALIVSGCGPAATGSPPPASTLAPSPATPAASTATTATATPEPTATPPDPNTTWIRVTEPFGAGVRGELDAVTAFAGGVIAVGTMNGLAVSTSSTNGLTWSTPSPLPGGQDAYVDTIAAGPDLLIAAGSTSGCCGIGGRALFWTSHDGTSWQAVPNTTGFGNAGVAAVAAFGRAFVAVGIANATEVGNDAAFWYSADGASWSRLTAVPGLSTGWMHDVTVRAGRLVAVGTRGNPNIGPTRTWLSSNGKTWTLATTSEPLQSAVFGAIEPTEGGFAAVGYVAVAAGWHPAAWTSSDGSTWVRTLLKPSLGSTSSIFDDVAATDGGLIAIENNTPEGAMQQAVLWRWTAAGGWTVLDTGAAFSDVCCGNHALHAAILAPNAATGVAATRIVIAGTTNNPNDPEPAIWVGPAAP